MKQLLLTSALLFCFSIGNAQVGIGTTSPDSQLDIRSSNQATPANNDGILIPKVDTFPAINPTAAQQGMLVYLTTSTTFLATTRQPGFYYWNNPTSDWIGLSSTANGDHDWYESATTSAPNNINDNMYHMGNVGIGISSLTPNMSLQILNPNNDTTIYHANSSSSTNSKVGIHNSMMNSTAGTQYATYNNIVNPSNADKYGVYNTFGFTGSGFNTGVYNDLNSASGTGVQTGVHTNIGNGGDAIHYGTRNILSGTGIGQKYGVRNELSANGNQTGTHNLLSGPGGNIITGTTNEITNTGLNIKIGVNNSITGNSAGDRYGISNLIFGDITTNTTTGLLNQLFTGGIGGIKGIDNQITASATTGYYGTTSDFTGTGDGTIYGTKNNIINSGNGIHYGMLNTMSGTGTGLKYGVRNELSGNGSQFGTYNIFTGSGTGTRVGSYNEITVNNTFAHTGVLSTLSGTGSGLKTGIYSYIAPGAGGTHYGIYSEVLKPGSTNFAGYFLGNVGIGTTGGNIYIMPPSRGTNGQIMRTDALGNVTWQNPGNFAWLTTGNAGTVGGNTTTAGTNFIGTTDNQNMDIRTNNIYRARFSNLGEFFVGTLNTIITGDLANFVSNATFPWAANGYSDQNGSGVYGQVTAGTTIFGAVQGEYNGTHVQGAGVRGIALTGTAGTSFGATHTGVNGQGTTSGSYKFGVYGSGGTSTRSGGVMGYDYGISIGALGYYANSAVDYGVYGFGQAYQTGVAGGRLSNTFNQKDTTIGLGIYGGVMGGWVRGLKFGFHTKGETYSLYVDGSGYTNKPLAYLISTDAQTKTASFMSTSLQPEVTVNGKVTLENGKVFVPFEPAFQHIISNIEDVIITASPQGKSNGVYIDQISKEGFWIYENNDGTSNTKIAWIAITKIKGEENPTVPKELLATDFDAKMDGVMFNDNNTVDTPQSLWWDGTQIRWDRPKDEKVDTETAKVARPTK